MRVVHTLLFGVTLLCLALAFQLHAVGDEAVRELRAEALRASEAETIKVGLINRIQMLLGPPLSLSGIDVSYPRKLWIEVGLRG